MTATPGVGMLAAPADGGAASRGAGRPPARAADDELIVRVLFAQARRRRRRIRLAGSAIVAALAVAAVALGLAWPRHAPGRGGTEPPAVPARRTLRGSRCWPGWTLATAW